MGNEQEPERNAIFLSFIIYCLHLLKCSIVVFVFSFFSVTSLISAFIQFLCPTLKKKKTHTPLIRIKDSDNFHDNIKSFKLRLTTLEQNYTVAPVK